MIALEYFFMPKSVAIMAIDSMQKYDLQLAELSDETKADLLRFVKINNGKIGDNMQAM